MDILVHCRCGRLPCPPAGDFRLEIHLTLDRPATERRVEQLGETGGVNGTMGNLLGLQ